MIRRHICLAYHWPARSACIVDALLHSITSSIHATLPALLAATLAMAAWLCLLFLFLRPLWFASPDAALPSSSLTYVSVHEVLSPSFPLFGLLATI